MIEVMVDDGITLPLTEEKLIEAITLACVEADDLSEEEQENLELCIRFATDDVVKRLNAEWRDKDKATDVLSFPMQEDEEIDYSDSLGDIILGFPFIEKEAKRLQLPLADHLLHLVIHGTLHLIGFDHIEDDEAEDMQQLENQVMEKLGLHIPYPEWMDTVIHE